jgi:hypothetical protein
MDLDLYCQFLHQNNPYLKLGPMKFEMLNSEPEIDLLHDFLSDKEIHKLKATVENKLFTTPLLVDGIEKKFSKLRTSKIKYINELIDQNALKISQRIERATKFVLFQTQFDSENYQVRWILEIIVFTKVYINFPLFLGNELWSWWTHIHS